MAHVLTKLTIVPKADCSEAAALAKELGLELQAKRYEKPLAESAFTELSDSEIRLWRAHCPTRYVPGGGTNVRALEQYAFDSVPLEVMRHWKAIKDNYSFDHFEVWTTERTPVTSDPLLIGVIGQKLYLLARWGLESPEAMPLRKIAANIHDSMLKKEIDDFNRLTGKWPWQSEEERSRKVEKKAIDWCLHQSGNRAIFEDCRRLLGLEIPRQTFFWSNSYF